MGHPGASLLAGAPVDDGGDGYASASTATASAFAATGVVPVTPGGGIDEEVGHEGPFDLPGRDALRRELERHAQGAQTARPRGTRAADSTRVPR